MIRYSRPPVCLALVSYVGMLAWQPEHTVECVYTRACTVNSVCVFGVSASAQPDGVQWKCSSKHIGNSCLE